MLGRLAPYEHLLCLSHTLHLVVTDVLYPKKKSDSGEDADEDDELSETLGRDDSSEDEDNIASSANSPPLFLLIGS